MNNTKAIEEVYGDQFQLEKKEAIIVLLLNMNRLRTEDWAIKNNTVRDFILESDVDIITFQETNINWYEVSQRDRWEE